jgi:ferredoxin
MSFLRYALVNVVGTLGRFFPWPSRTGVIEIGRPGRASPVLVTCSYRLTVERLRRALRGVDAYLLVANSRGVNVWCAATGGLLTNHDVLSALKTTGIGNLVDHRQVILPQLAATGVEARPLEAKSGWKVVWGPVYAEDIPAFLDGQVEKSAEMRQVRFPWRHRLEMAVAWAFLVSLVSVLILAVIWRQALLPGTLVLWGLAFALYLCFPLYGYRLGSGSRGRMVLAGVLVGWWGVAMAILACYTWAVAGGSWGEIVKWAIYTLVISLVLGVDLRGSTPLYWGGFQEDGRLKVVLERARCMGVGYCQEVCPRDCYKVDRARHSASMPGAERCVQCGACIVQCPNDALHFENMKGGIITPDTIRRFKLNLMGKRVEIGG